MTTTVCNVLQLCEHKCSPACIERAARRQLRGTVCVKHVSFGLCLIMPQSHFCALELIVCSDICHLSNQMYLYHAAKKHLEQHSVVSEFSLSSDKYLSASFN